MLLRRTLIAVCLICAGLWPPGGHAGEKPAPDRGAAGLLQAIERLGVVAGVLVNVAHPDDENAGLLTYLARGRHARAVLLTATRGEGGQNMIGPEKGAALGLVRTGELLAADQYYGVEQRFSGAIDFGFSKTAEETLDKWGREATLRDFVRVIRRERPDVIISRFEGAPRDGHGHHQAVGILTREAFGAAADPGRFPDQLEAGLRPWQAQKLVLDHSWTDDLTADDDRLIVDVGRFDPLSGLSFHELGVRGWTHHRSQDMAGRIASKGPRPVALTSLKSHLADPRNGTDLLGGIDTSIVGIAKRVGAEGDLAARLAEGLTEIQDAARAALESFAPRDPGASAPHVLGGLEGLRTLIGEVDALTDDERARSELLFHLGRKERDFLDAARRALALEIEARAKKIMVVPGETFNVSISVFNRGRIPVRLEAVNLHAPGDWEVSRTGGNLANLEPESHARFEYTVRVATNAEASRPAIHRGSGSEYRYEAVDGADISLADSPPLLTAELNAEALSTMIRLTRPVKAADVSRSQGVLFRDVMVGPAVSLDIEPDLVVVPTSSQARVRTVHVNVTNHSPTAVEGTVELRTPTDWRVSPTSARFECRYASATATIPFQVTVPTGYETDETPIGAVAHLDGRDYAESLRVIDYPHTWRRQLLRPARCVFKVFDVEVAPDLNVGYILGKQDEVPGALDRLGVSHEFLDERDLGHGDFDQYDAIIAGPRAYAEREDLKAHNGRLLAYVNKGGVFIVQYNKTYDWDPALYAPYPAKMTHNERITREEAPLKILQPDHPLFNQPNKITSRDFEGWVQERGLYFMTEWDQRYVPLLAGADPGEEPLRGGTLVAQYGEGLYVYTALAWFRQLPAGVPGAYRLFANLISLPKSRRID